LQKRIDQQSNENNEIRLTAIQNQSNLQIQIEKLQLEKQNMEFYIQQSRS
jgi:uncharacterized protein YpmS